MAKKWFKQFQFSSNNILKFQRIFAVIYFTLSIIISVFIMTQLWEKFETKSTFTGFNVDFKEEIIPFPAITLCPDNPIKLDILQTFFEVNINDTNLIKNLGSLSLRNLLTLDLNLVNTTNIDNIPKFLNKILIQCSDLFFNCKWKGQNINCCNELIPVFTEQGYCFSFNKRNINNNEFSLKTISKLDDKWSLSLTILGITQLKDYFDETILENNNDYFDQDKKDDGSLKIFIHGNNEFIEYDTAPHIIWHRQISRLLLSQKTTYTTDDSIQLKISQRKCIFHNEVALLHNYMYSYTWCKIQCRMKTTMKYCSCIPFFYQFITKSFRSCSLKELICIRKYIKHILETDQCQCELPCNHTIYELKNLETTAEITDDLEIEIAEWPAVTFKREILFGWLDLFVSFGGVAGAFLGINILSILRIIYRLIINRCLYNQENEKIRTKREIEKIKQKWAQHLHKHNRVHVRNKKPKAPFNLEFIP